MRRMNKKGLINLRPGILQTTIGGVILIVVLFIAFAELYPTFTNATQEVANTGGPLTSLFASDGVMPLLLVAGLILVVVGATNLAGRRR